jgi:hypothetical protein
MKIKLAVIHLSAAAKPVRYRLRQSNIAEITPDGAHRPFASGLNGPKGHKNHRDGPP